MCSNLILVWILFLSLYVCMYFMYMLQPFGVTNDDETMISRAPSGTRLYKHSFSSKCTITTPQAVKVVKITIYAIHVVHWFLNNLIVAWLKQWICASQTRCMRRFAMELSECRTIHRRQSCVNSRQRRDETRFIGYALFDRRRRRASPANRHSRSVVIK